MALCMSTKIHVDCVSYRLLGFVMWPFLFTVLLFFNYITFPHRHHSSQKVNWYKNNVVLHLLIIPWNFGHNHNHVWKKVQNYTYCKWVEKWCTALIIRHYSKCWNANAKYYRFETLNSWQTERKGKGGEEIAYDCKNNNSTHTHTPFECCYMSTRIYGG